MMIFLDDKLRHKSVYPVAEFSEVLQNLLIFIFLHMR